MLNIVIPMAGRGSRFSAAGFADPKPLVKLHGVAMIRVVIANLAPRIAHRFIFICQREHYVAYGLDRLLSEWTVDPQVVLLDGVTEGAACTVLRAREWIDTEAPLMIANSDQYIATSIDDYLQDMARRELDGLIMTMAADDPKWSFAATTPDGLVTRVVEKQVISNDATVGIYNFAQGRDFVAAADAMIAAGERSNGEFYVAPVYNRMLASGARIGIHGIGVDGNGMHGLGTPADLAAFLALPLSVTATRGL